MSDDHDRSIAARLSVPSNRMYWQPDCYHPRGGYYVRRGAPDPPEPRDEEQEYEDKLSKADADMDAARDRE